MCTGIKAWSLVRASRARGSCAGAARRCHWRRGARGATGRRGVCGRSPSKFHVQAHSHGVYTLLTMGAQPFGFTATTLNQQCSSASTVRLVYTRGAHPRHGRRLTLAPMRSPPGGREPEHAAWRHRTHKSRQLGRHLRCRKRSGLTELYSICSKPKLYSRTLSLCRCVTTLCSCLRCRQSNNRLLNHTALCGGC